MPGTTKGISNTPSGANSSTNASASRCRSRPNNFSTSSRELSTDSVATIRTAIGTLLTRAQQAGAVRTDIETDDLMRILKGAFLATHSTSATPAQRNRTFAVVFDGLRAR